MKKNINNLAIYTMFIEAFAEVDKHPKDICLQLPKTKDKFPNLNFRDPDKRINYES